MRPLDRGGPPCPPRQAFGLQTGCRPGADRRTFSNTFFEEGLRQAGRVKKWGCRFLYTPPKTGKKGGAGCRVFPLGKTSQEAMSKIHKYQTQSRLRSDIADL